MKNILCCLVEGRIFYLDTQNYNDSFIYSMCIVNIFCDIGKGVCIYTMLISKEDTIHVQ
jgi:hypothetical protein